VMIDKIPSARLLAGALVGACRSSLQPINGPAMDRGRNAQRDRLVIL
jgi:hypothetical protein